MAHQIHKHAPAHTHTHTSGKKTEWKRVSVRVCAYEVRDGLQELKFIRIDSIKMDRVTLACGITFKPSHNNNKRKYKVYK